MSDDQTPSKSDRSSLEPDDLMKDVGKLSIMKTSLISIAFHVLLIGLTSIGFIALCVKHGTLHPKAVLNQPAEEQREAERARAREEAREKIMGGRRATRPGGRGPATRAKSRIEKAVTETSREKPKPSNPLEALDRQ